MKCIQCDSELDKKNNRRAGNRCHTCYLERRKEIKKLKKQGLWLGRNNDYLKNHAKTYLTKTDYKTENNVRYKLCSMCQNWKTYNYYQRDKRNEDGFKSNCRDCVRNNVKKYQEKCKTIPPPKAYPHYKNNDGNIVKKCKLCLIEKELKCFYRSNGGWDKLTAICKECTYYKNKSNIQRKIKNKLSCRIYAALKSIGKNHPTMELIGCSLGDFMKHIENLFQIGMEWNNHGTWHLDHIIPCSSFDLTDAEEQKKCFHYTNLQPLWAEDNFRKNNRLDWKKED